MIHNNFEKTAKYYVLKNYGGSIVLKLSSVINSAGVLGHWVNGQTTESLVEPHD